MAVRIKSVQKGSLAQSLGLAAGSMLYSADGNEINDLLDYRFYTSAKQFELAVMRGGKLEYLAVENPNGEPFGCDFERYLADEGQPCTNKCIFCMCDQLPAGVHESLSCKKDDERLSFLTGNYITLTNLNEHDVQRILDMGISPINIAVHTTNGQLRSYMLGNPRAGQTLKYLNTFATAGIQMNIRMCLCRGINDGNELDASLEQLTGLYPAVRSISVVQSLLTSCREGLETLPLYDKRTSAQALAIVEKWGSHCKEKHGTRLVYASDEWYLRAGRPLPAGSFYEDDCLLRNGVGRWRLFHDSFLAELVCAKRAWPLPHKIDIVTGALQAPLAHSLFAMLCKKHRLIRITLHPIANNLFGGNISAAELTAGADIVAQCRGKLKSKHLGIPETMVWEQKTLFVDGLSVQDLEKALGVKVHILPGSGARLAKALLATRWD